MMGNRYNDSAAEYVKAHGTATTDMLVDVLGYPSGAKRLQQALRAFCVDHPNLYEVAVCGRKTGTWAWREPKIPERMRRSILDVPPLDMRVLGRPVIVVR